MRKVGFWTCLCTLAPLAALAAPPAMASAFLAYVNAPPAQEDIRSPPRLKIGFGEKNYDVTMDTGSTGIVISARMIPDFDTRAQVPGELTYTSSGRIMRGQWVTIPVTISGANGAQVKTEPIPVLAVTEIACLQRARDCTPTTAPAHVSMMGVGFGREYDRQKDSTPRKNPFLNVQDDPSGQRPARRGYLVTRPGVQIGLGDDDASGFALIKLEAEPGIAGEWQQAPVCLSVNDTAPPACGSVLVDTGVRGIYLTLPRSQAGDAATETESGGLTLEQGTKLSIVLTPDGSRKDVPRVSYQLVIGEEGNPLAPAFLRLNLTRPTPFINTGVTFLNGFDYLYDADRGMVGYRWTGHAPQGIGEARPQRER